MSERYKRNRKAVNMQPASAEEGAVAAVDMVELFYHLIDGWKQIGGCAFLLAALMAVYSFFIATPLYEATSTIYVLNPSDSAINLSDLQLGTALTQDYIKIFSMWEVHETVIDNLDLPYSYDDMRGMLSVTNSMNTRMLDITITHSQAERAAQIANEYARVASQYIADTMKTDQPSIMSVALVPQDPIRPRKVRNIALGGMIGAVFACVYIAMKVLLDDRIRTADDVARYTGLPTLAMIPAEKIEKAKKQGGTHE